MNYSPLSGASQSAICSCSEMFKPLQADMSFNTNRFIAFFFRVPLQNKDNLFFCPRGPLLLLMVQNWFRK